MDTGLIVGLLLALGLVGFIIWLKWSKPKRENSDEIENFYQAIGIGKHKREFKFFGTTPHGAPYRSVVPFPREAQDAYDRGILEQIRIVRQYQQLPPEDNRCLAAWTNALNVSDYPVDLIHPTGLNEETEPGSPHINVGQYKTAGTVGGMNEMTEEIKKRPFLVMPHQEGQGWRFLNYFQNTAQFEGEHLCEFLCRNQEPKNLWLRYVHVEDSHPHRPDLNAVGLMSKSAPRCHIATN